MAELRQEEQDLLRAAEQGFRLLGTSVRVAVENSVRDGQDADIREIVAALHRREPGLEVRAFDPKGGLIASSPGNGVPSDLVEKLVRNPRSSDEPYIRFEGLSNLVGVFPLRDDDGSGLGSVVVVQPLDELRRDLAATKVSALVSSLTLIAGSVSVTWALVLLLVRRPLVQLTQAMRSLRSGDLLATLSFDRADELGAAAAEFNSMVHELREAKRQLEEAAASRRELEAGLQRVDKLVTFGQLSAGLAHEIGSPLQILNGRARALARRADVPSDVVRVARVLEEQSERVARIVEQLLSVARCRKANVRRLDLRSTVGAIIELVEPEARKRGLGLDYECSDAVPEIVADGDQVQQIAINLLRNSLRATRPGGRVRVALFPSSIETDDRGGERASVCLVVEDDGVGIPGEALASVFEPFYTTWTEAGGVGLGLTVVKSIVEEHGGQVRLTSEPGSGAKVTVQFPISPGGIEGMVA